MKTLFASIPSGIYDDMAEGMTAGSGAGVPGAGSEWVLWLLVVVLLLLMGVAWRAVREGAELKRRAVKRGVLTPRANAPFTKDSL